MNGSLVKSLHPIHKENPPVNEGLLLNYCLILSMWTHQDSNLEPMHYERDL